MSEVRNPEKRLVFTVDEKNRTVEHREKGWITRIEFSPDGKTKVRHIKANA
jgi:hypothetical protein